MFVQTKEIDILKHQLLFMHSKKRFVANVAGFGSGKSAGIGFKSYQLAKINRGFPGAIVSRSGGQMYRLQQEVEKSWNTMGLRYLDLKTYRRDRELTNCYTTYGGDIYWIRWEDGSESEIFCLTTENNAYMRWAGGNLSWMVIDEIDTMPKADEVWKYANDRVRVGPFNQTACASTPEGYGFLWDFFDNQPRQDALKVNDRELIRGCTFDNPYINIDYVRNQIQTRDPHSLRAYVYGEFVNLDGALVYYRFNKEKNVTPLRLENFGPEYICQVGVDFNKGINATSISIVDGDNLYTVDEVVGCSNVDQLIGVLTKKLYGRPIKVYPDASGYEAIQQLERAFGENAVIYDPANPEIYKRVYSCNMRFKDATGKPRAFINPTTCPNTFNAVMRQVKGPDGKPKKDGLDHFTDAWGYKVSKLWPADPQTGYISVIQS